MKTIKECLAWGHSALEGLSPSASLDAQVLLGFAAKLTKTNIIANPDRSVGDEDSALYRKLIEKRKTGVPVAYLIGTKEFYGLDFEVNDHVLIPRPETEHLVEHALLFIEKTKKERKIRILDLGTGSGCISISIAHELSKKKIPFEILAIDKSPGALLVAKGNAEKHGLSTFVSFRESHWFSQLTSDDGRFDLILSNPPYIARDDNALSLGTAFEPKSALFADDEGLSDIKLLVQEVSKFLAAEGSFLCEMGYQQRESLEVFFEELRKKRKFPYRQVNFYKDLAGLDRGFELQGCC